MDSHAPPAAHDAARDAAYAEWISEARAVPITRPLERLAARLVVRSGELVGPCPVCGGRDRFAVSLRKGVFHCRGSGEGGDVIALTRYLEACDFHTACAILTGRNRPGQEPVETAEARAARRAVLAKRAAALARVTETARRTEARFRERERVRCWQLWKAARPLPGTAAEAYLARRGLVAPPGAPLRCLPDHPLYADGRAGAAIVHRGPALVAPIVGPSGRFAGLHATWIDLAGPMAKRTSWILRPAPSYRPARCAARLGVAGYLSSRCETPPTLCSARVSRPCCPSGGPMLPAAGRIGRLPSIGPPTASTISAAPPSAPCRTRPSDCATVGAGSDRGE